MCKLLLMSGMDPKKKKLNWEFITKMASEMSTNNTDGLGYAAVDKNGNLLGEHWFFNWQAFDNRKKMTEPKIRDHEAIKPLKDGLKDFVELEDEPNYEPFQKYDSFGTLTEDVCAVTLHTRYATSPKIFQNTHPFIDLDKSISIVHNGVIRNHTKADEIRSTCDSERVLNQYILHEVDKVPADVQNMVDGLKGSFAVGAFALDKDNIRVLDVWRTSSTLSVAFIKELNCLVMSTSLDDIKRVVNDMGLTIISKSGSTKEDVFQRFNAVTGKPILTLKYKDTTRYTSSYEDNYDMYDGYQSPYGSTGGTGHNNLGNNHHVHSRQAFQDRMAARKAATDKIKEDLKKDSSNVQLITSTSSANPPPVIDWIKLTEAQRIEVRELRKAGFGDAEIKEALERKLPNSEKVAVEVISETAQVAEVITATVVEIDKANAIIKNTDPLNENEAVLDGYELNDTKELWIKKNAKLH